jgi:hypothetical protein
LAAVEKSSGEYHFRAIDQLIEKLDQRKIRLLFIINYGNPSTMKGGRPSQRPAASLCPVLFRSRRPLRG